MLEPFHISGVMEAGCDEAGRGCIAGPVYAAAVILPPDFREPGLNDSKKLSPGKREMLRRCIEAGAVSFGIGKAEVQEIDAINILNASFLAMHRALEQLDREPEQLIIDGNRFRPFGGVPHTCMVKGDARYASIAAASILAKTYRDAHMDQLHQRFPEYGWNDNRGYPTRAHRMAVHRYGPTPHHRRSFRLLDNQMQLDFS